MTKVDNNRLLKALTQASQASVMASSEFVRLSKGYVLYESGMTPRFAHFLLSGLATVVLPLEMGSSIECGLIGREGIPETLHLLGPGPPVTRCVVQAPATALRIRIERFQQLLNQDVALRHLVLQFNQSQFQIATHIAYCDALHDVTKRISRLLLMMADRLSDAALPVTHDGLARMIGAQRPTVTVAVGSLQKKGLIDYKYRKFRIVDRSGLEQGICECYKETRRLLHSLYFEV